MLQDTNLRGGGSPENHSFPGQEFNTMFHYPLCTRCAVHGHLEKLQFILFSISALANKYT